MINMLSITGLSTSKYALHILHTSLDESATKLWSDVVSRNKDNSSAKALSFGIDVAKLSQLTATLSRVPFSNICASDVLLYPNICLDLVKV